MNTEKTLQISCGNVEATKRLAEQLAKNVKGGDVVEFTSDLGGGKTTFVKFLVAALGSDDVASSPSFTIENVYTAGEYDIHHFDFYRLEEAGIMGNELDEVLGDDKKIVLVEWGGLVEDILPVSRLKVRISVTGDNSRCFDITYADDYKPLVEGLYV